MNWVIAVVCILAALDSAQRLGYERGKGLPLSSYWVPAALTGVFTGLATHFAIAAYGG